MFHPQRNWKHQSLSSQLLPLSPRFHPQRNWKWWIFTAINKILCQVSSSKELKVDRLQFTNKEYTVLFHPQRNWKHPPNAVPIPLRVPVKFHPQRNWKRSSRVVSQSNVWNQVSSSKELKGIELRTHQVYRVYVVSSSKELKDWHKEETSQGTI